MRPTPPSIPHTISRYAYAELRAFCRQYGEKKSRAAALAGVSSPILTGMPHGSDISDPVTRAVERRERLLADCAMIERAAELAGGGGFYHALILNCCHGIGYLYMDPAILPTANRNAFFRARREFYWLLHQIRKWRNLILFFDGFVLKWHREKRNRPVGRSAKAPRSFLYKKSREVVNMDGR